jgi:NTP pyrophosphatase (non-canonical NTP hydrolase)
VEFAEVTERALAIRTKLEAYEQRAFGRMWSVEELLLGLVGDLGDLAKLIQAREGIRNVENAKGRLEHELADVLWSVIVLANRCGVDLEQAFLRTMSEIESSLEQP